MDAAGLALNVATICSKLAWNLYKFVHKVKEAPEQAREFLNKKTQQPKRINDSL